MILKAQDTQFRLHEDGQIFYQKDASNPTPGDLLAYVVKGETILAPRVVLFESNHVSADDKAGVRDYVQAWLGRHIAAVLDPLPALVGDEAMKGPAKGIAFQVHEALGIVPREQVEDLIATLDQDDRKALREKRVRLGPVLVFIPALNKPAAVRLRALLWGLYNDKALPMQCPKDGIVSYAPEKPFDKSFFQSIGYPVYGGRAIRIDMLDRVISAIYDSANEGKFQAQHKMAEWLGCSIDGLYEVLEAMGHTKIEGPAIIAEQEPELEDPKASEAEPAQQEAPKVEDAPTEGKPAEQVKPALAMFRLKKGKAFKRSGGPKKPFHKKPEHKGAGKPDRKGDKGKGRADRDRGPKVISTGPKPKLEDSPFAILEQLKKKSDG